MCCAHTSRCITSCLHYLVLITHDKDPVCIRLGTHHTTVSIDDTIGDLPRFDWCANPPFLVLSRLPTLLINVNSRTNPSLSRLPAQKRNEARAAYTGVRPREAQAVRYHHPPCTMFQALCRKGHMQVLQHFMRMLKPETVEW